MSGRSVWALCRSCAESVYGTRAPNERYADAVARLLLGTAAQESAGFRYRRQLGFRADSLRGAFGLWQCELASIRASVEWVRERPELLRNASAWLADGWDGGDLAHLPEYAIPAILQRPDGDRLSCLLGRAHYLRVADPVPDTLAEQAVYWKRWYNTRLGRGRAEDYVRSWQLHCAPVLRGEG